MRLPRRLKELLASKQEFIDLNRDKLDNTVIKLQSTLFGDVIDNMIGELDIKDGLIVDNAKNYRLISTLDKTYKDFQKLSTQILAGQVVITTEGIAGMNDEYFKLLFSELPKRFDKIIAKTNRLMNLRIGLDGGELVRGGFLQSFFDSNTLGTDLKDVTSKAIASGVSKRDYIKSLRMIINGTEDRSGGLERQFQRYAYDLYQHYDAAYNLVLGNEFGLKYFIYQGGRVKDTRDFCIAHNNKLWHISDLDTWATWVPADGDYPSGYEIQQKDIYAVPSYLGYPGYDPGIDRGGYNCRHSLGWVTDEYAKRELK